jgi:hypothetical protein
MSSATTLPTEADNEFGNGLANALASTGDDDGAVLQRNDGFHAFLGS